MDTEKIKDINALWNSNLKMRSRESLSRMDLKILEGFINNQARKLGLSDDTLADINHNSKELKFLKESMVCVLQLKPEAVKVFKQNIA